MNKSRFLLIDKSKNWTSFDVVAKLRGITKVKTIGHSGTLDPLATGLLLVAVGREATKKLGQLKGQTKTYLATLELGKVSNTYDATGEIKDLNIKAWPSEDEIKQALLKFTGAIQQVPPMFSAKKINGQKLYDLARKGIEVERKSCTVTINKVDLIKYSAPILKLEIECSAGTYIRSLAHDLGEVLKTGAIMTELRRIKVGEYKIDQAITLDKLNKENWEEYLFDI